MTERKKFFILSFIENKRQNRTFIKWGQFVISRKMSSKFKMIVLQVLVDHR